MNSSDFRSPALYTVPLMGSDGPTDGFFAHEDLLSRLLADLNLENPEYIPRHHFLLGSSGLGKTTFLTQLAYKVTRDAQWLPLLFSEPQYNVSNMGDFWRNCLYRLADNMTNPPDANAAVELRTKISGLASGDSQSAEDLLMAEVRGRNKQLLLLIDDIDALLSRSEELYIELFVTLQNVADLVVIGTGSTELKNIDAEASDFSALFQVTKFECLRQDEVSNAMLRLANGSHPKSVESFLNQHPHRYAMLHRLSGGNPRAIKLIYSFIVAGLDGDICGKLAAMFDVITPAYLARMASLSVLRQKILDLVAVRQDPITLTQIAKILGLTMEEATLEQAYLEQHGFVSRAEGQHPSDGTTFEIGERLLNVWYLMYTERLSCRQSVWLVLFLKEFFSAAELEMRARDHIQMPSLSRHEMDYTLALIQTVENKPLRDALEHSVLLVLTGEGRQATEIYRLFYWKENDTQLPLKIGRLERRKAIENRILDAVSNSSIVAQPLCEALMGSPTLTENEKAKFAEQLSDYSSDQWTALDKFLINEGKYWRRMLGYHAISLYKSIASGLMAQLKDTEGAESAAEYWQDPMLAAFSWAVWLDSAGRPSTQKIDYIEQVFRRSLDADPNVALIWNSLGNLLQFHAQRFTEAETAYRTAIGIDPHYTAPWSQIAYLLNRYFKRFDEAEEAYNKTIELDPRNPTMYNNFAWFLYQHRRRVDDAISLSERACELASEDLYSIHTRATLLVKRGDWEEAVPFIRRFVQQSGQMSGRVVWRAGIILFQEIVGVGRAREGIALLDEMDVMDLWGPVKQALGVMVSDDPNDFSRLDVNVNAQVKEIIASLTGTPTGHQYESIR